MEDTKTQPSSINNEDVNTENPQPKNNEENEKLIKDDKNEEKIESKNEPESPTTATTTISNEKDENKVEINQENNQETKKEVKEVKEETLNNKSNDEIKVNEENNEKKEEKEEKNYEEELTNILNLSTQYKQEGNKFFKDKDYQKADGKYREGIELSENYIQDYKGDIENPIFKNIKKENVCLYSNLSNCIMQQENFMEVFNIDMYIISRLDANWDKSYNRIIRACLKNNELQLANQYATIFRSRFAEETISKYQQTFDLLNEENKKFYEKNQEKMKANANTTGNTTQDNMSETISDTRSLTSKNKSITSKKKRKPFFFKFIFGGFVLFGALASFFFIFKNRQKSIK